ncbi:unnamed protein product [Chironomus riparius]|uniref:Condensin complex subunit 1 C-terminal domain-containing protein n=1 Tax=Chironomus riparius TaxID=315576 RepID=A0A9N9WUQ7_9DIPT|nr:unnamed protein product [Chironomus riparius]
MEQKLGQRLENRFDSFEFSDSDISQTSLRNTIVELQHYFPDKSLEVSQINDIIDESIDNNEDNGSFVSIPAYDIKFVKKIRKDMQCTESLKLIRSLLDESRNSDEIVNWDLIVKEEKFNVNCYITFIYTLMRLFDIDQKDKINKELSFNAGRTYICLLGLPGAKRCFVWDRDLIITYFKLLNYHKRFKECDHYLELQIIQMLNECKKVFNIVCLSDQVDVLEKYVETLASILEYYLSNSNRSALETIMCCYDNFESLCLRPLPDEDIENTMYLIFCRTVELHFINSKKRQGPSSRHGEAISDFFLHLLSTYSLKTKNVLTKFIKSLLSNPDHKYDREKFQKLYDVAVKYELAIYWKSNESIIEYLQKLAMSSDHRHRLNCVEFCGRMLLINTTPDPQESPNADVPRELRVLKILFEKIYDKQDAVKLKALASIKTAILNGNGYTKKILDVVFRKHSASDNPEIWTVLGESVGKFQKSLLALLQTSSATYIKKTCLEILTQHCGDLIDNEIFIDIITSLTDDQSYLVKNQLLELVNTVIRDHPKNNNAVEMWLDVIISLVRDNDTKIVDSAIKSLTSIFQKIESFENTVNDAQILPWTVVKLILSKGKRGLLQNAIETTSNNFLTQDKLRKIETHIFTSNKTEAWCILSLIAKKMKSNNPDIIIKTFLDCITAKNYDTNDFHLILEVIQNWIETFSDNSRAQMLGKMTEVLLNGECPISVISHLYETCILTISSLLNDEEIKKFSTKLNEVSKKFILTNFVNFHVEENSEKMLSYLLIYCESNTDVSVRPDKRILNLLFDFLKKILNNQIIISVQNDIPRKVNIIIIVLTRFAIRDNELAAELTPDLATLLRKNLNISVIKTTMQCLNDLCKKHTSTVAPVFKEIIYKLHSKSEEVRLCALANIYDLVMQDFIKMKGRVLLNMLACLVDKNEMIQLKSQAAILNYTNDKNQNLLYTCFIESVFLFNNFIQPENFGVFPLDEIDLHLLLLNGDEKREQRHELYRFFVQNIHDINEVHLLLLFKQIILLKEKLEKKKFKKNANGTNTFKDLLYIFKLICEKRGESKMKMNKTEGVEEDYAENDHGAQTSTNENQKGNSRKNKNTLTLNDAIPVVEKMIQIYPAFSKLVIEYESSLKSCISDLTASIVTNFASFIEYSKENFWKQLKDNTAEKKTSNKRKRVSKKINKSKRSDDDESEEDMDLE